MYATAHIALEDITKIKINKPKDTGLQQILFLVKCTMRYCHEMIFLNLCLIIYIE